MEHSILPSSYDHGLVITEEMVSDQPTKTWAFELDGNRCQGTVDGADALIQTIYAILNTERGKYHIYPYDFGLQKEDLRGKAAPYVFAMLQMRIKDALLFDERIIDVTDFAYDSVGDTMLLNYKVHTTISNEAIEGAYYVRRPYFTNNTR